MIRSSDHETTIAITTTKRKLPLGFSQRQWKYEIR